MFVQTWQEVEQGDETTAVFWSLVECRSLHSARDWPQLSSLLKVLSRFLHATLYNVCRRFGERSKVIVRTMNVAVVAFSCRHLQFSFCCSRPSHDQGLFSTF